MQLLCEIKMIKRYLYPRLYKFKIQGTNITFSHEMELRLLVPLGCLQVEEHP